MSFTLVGRVSWVKVSEKPDPDSGEVKQYKMLTIGGRDGLFCFVETSLPLPAVGQRIEAIASVDQYKKGDDYVRLSPRVTDYLVIA